jgi:hypothetical protein
MESVVTACHKDTPEDQQPTRGAKEVHPAVVISIGVQAYGIATIPGNVDPYTTW